MKRILNKSDSITVMSLSASLSGVLPYSKNPEDFSICQVLYTPTQRIMIFPASSASNMTAKQLIEQVSSEAGVDTNLDLMIQFPNNFLLVLDEDDNPFSISESLFFLPFNPDDRKKLHTHYLKVSPKKLQIRSSLYIPVIDQNSNLLYMMPIQSTPSTFSMGKIIELILNVHKCSPDSISVYTRRGQKLSSETIKRVTIRHILKGTIYMSLFTTGQISTQIQKRVNVLNELKSTELTFSHTIDGFVDNVSPILKKTNILTSSELENFKNAVNYISGLQKKIVFDLKEMRLDYMTLIGRWFKEFAPYLKGYNQYLTFYKTFLPKITKAMNSKEYSNIFESFLDSSFSNSLRFDSVLIIPVQHSPRYVLLLREVLKETPNCHPDYEDLINTFDLVDETIQKLNSEVTLLQKRHELINLESRFTSTVDLIKPNRSFIGSFKAQYNQSNFLFLLFSDELWICAVSKGQKLTKQSVLTYEDTNATKYANKSVLLHSLSGMIDRKFLLESGEMQDQFISNFRKASINFLSQKRNQIKMHYQLIEQNKKISLADHCCACLNGIFYIFGGRDNEGKARNDFYRFSIENPTFEKMPIKGNSPSPSPRFMAAFCVIDTGVFLYGGTDDEKNCFSDFWFYSFKYERWQEMSKKNDPENDPPPPGFGLELFYTKSKQKGDILVLTGGRDEFGIYVYALRQKVWKFVEVKNGIDLLSLYGHSAVPLNGRNGCCIIIGGKNSDGNYNNFTFFLSNDGESVFPIVLSRISPINRFQHRCVCIKNVIFCLGGDSDESIPFALRLKYSRFTVPKIEGEKCQAVRGFALMTDGNDIYLHGGFDKKGNVISNLMKIAVVDNEINENDNLNLGESFEHDKLAMSVLIDPKSVNDDVWIAE